MNTKFAYGDRVRVVYEVPLYEATISADRDVVTTSFRSQEGWQNLYGRRGTIVGIDIESNLRFVVELAPGTRIHFSSDLLEHLHPLEQLAECAGED